MSRRFVQIIILVLFSISVLRAENARAEEKAAPFPADWAALKAELLEKGFDPGAQITNDINSNLSGGLHRRSTFPGVVDINLGVDASRAGMWENGSFFLHLMDAWKGEPSKNAGDYQGSDNIENAGVFRIHDAWYEHSFWNDVLSLRTGIQEYNVEFNTLDTALTLINSSFGTSGELPQSGVPIWPDSSPAARVSLKPSESSYLQAAVFDGVAGDPKHPHGTHIRWSRDEGVFYAAEAGLTSAPDEDNAPRYKLAPGVWYTTMNYSDYNGRERSDNYGYYLIGEHSLLCEEDCSQGLSTFFQLGYASPGRNQIGSYFGTGISYTGLFEGRDEDILAAGLAQVRNSSGFRATSAELEETETALEFTYSAQLSSSFLMQPDFQYIINPGTDSALKNAAVFTLRFALAL